MQLHEAVEQIIDAVVSAVEFETEAGTLSEVSAVVRGDRARPMPELPAVWVVADVAQMERAVYGEETWRLPVSIAALVKNDDAEQGGRDTQRLTALARSAALQLMDAERGNQIDADVTDVVSVSFDPAPRNSEKNRTLFWTEAVISVTFTVTE